MKKHRPPWKTTLYVWLAFIGISIVAGTTLVMLAGSSDHFASGQRLGQSIGQLSIAVAIVTYLIARRRQRKRDAADKHVDDVFR